MHLTHKLPWNQLADHFEFVSDGPRGAALYLRSTGGNSNSSDEESAERTARYFGRCLRIAVREFALAEIDRLEAANECRGLKVPLKADPGAPLFPDGLPLRGPYPVPQCQYLPYWEQCCLHDSEGCPSAEIMKRLVQHGESEAILRLLREPRGLHGIVRISGRFDFGVDQVVVDALPRYVMMNLAVAIRQRTQSERNAARPDPRRGQRPVADQGTGLPWGVSPRKQLRSLYEIGMIRRYTQQSYATGHAEMTMHNGFWAKHCSGKALSWGGGMPPAFRRCPRGRRTPPSPRTTTQPSRTPRTRGGISASASGASTFST